ncbi:MAG: carboxypeptidase regulatory-like domain-containing protein, partial [Planctomycetes bacterium]|nr:carboxypeptidase regulatory-like domain-containing protein [Planctomycetota bacterium]
KLVLKFQTPDGPPVGHVLIWRWPQGANHAYQWDSRKGDAVTLEFRPDDEGQKYRLIIEAEGFARPDSPRITVAKSMAPVSVKLEPPVAVTGRGRVVDQDGKPVAGARVRVGLWLGAREYETPWGPEPATDADGKYELRHLRAGDHFRVEAARDGLTRGVSPRLTAEEGAVVSIPDLRLSSAKHTLIGTITDPSGQPVADARVYTTTPVAKETQSNAAGKFVLYDLPADGNRVWVDAPGFIVREFGSLQEGADLRIRLDRLNPDPADFRLQVRLKPRDGGQVKQSEVWVVEKGPPAQLLFYSWPQDGRYDTGDVRTFGPRAGKTMVLAAEAEGYARPKPVEFSAGKRMQALEIELTPAAPVTIHGRVVDGNGKPVAGAGVGLSAQLYREALDEPWRFFGGNDQLPRTDAEGRFTLSGIAVGTRFAVHTGMSGTNRVVSEWRTAEKPGEVTLPDLVLRPGTRTLAGVVVDAEGRTVAGAKVVQRDRLGRVETVTDAQGKFQLEGLPEEKLYLRVEADDFPFWQGVAQAGQADLRVVLR